MKPIYKPWSLLDQFYQDLEHMYGKQAHRDEDSSTIATSTWVPAVDIQENKDCFIIYADIPGVEPKDIEITMDNGVLTIKGERIVARKEDKQYYKRTERVHGNFYRRFSLPDTADADKISAKGKQGVLEIVIPKKQLPQSRRINIDY